MSELCQHPITHDWAVLDPVRAMPNAFPALRAAGSGLPPGPEGDWRAPPGDNHHEVIVETPDHTATLGSLTAASLRAAAEAVPC